MVLQHVEHMQAMARGIVQSVQMLVTHAQLEFASFRPPTYLLSDIDNDLQQLIYVQEQADAQPSGDGAESSDLSTAVEDGDAQRSQKDHVKRLWDFLQQFQVHLEAFIRWIRRWLM
ncbi:uncharacterized protein LOC114713226 [Neltuma alba]|uniref:uncharacterized protein LOC114713226 n=1 Tax=Neltuma alba TaxID=207710 RepID=UPI0010A54231|nr:uncharacterized protein LOC114713226 [Prosopis alba]